MRKSKTESIAEKDSPGIHAAFSRTLRRERSKSLNWDRIILGLKKTTKEFIENVLENIIESIIVTNIDGRLVFFNKFSEEMFGYKAEEVLNRHIVVLGAQEPDVLGHIRRNQPYQGEITLKTKDGRRFPAHVRCVPLRDEVDQPIAMVGVARDLTREKEKQRIDQEIARLKAFNENIIASLNDGIQIIDLDGTIRFVNKRLEDLLEYPPGELLGLKYDAVMAGEGHRNLEELMTAAGEIPHKASFETRLVTRSSKKIPVMISASPLIEGGTVVGIVTAVMDVSEMHQLREGLFQSEKMSLIGTLASELAHEINNPLGGLIMAVQMLTEDISEGVVDRQTIIKEMADIESDARRCRTIVHKLLGFSRRVSEEPTLLNINTVIEDSLLLLQRETGGNDISFSKSYAEGIPYIRGNSIELQQVIINLIKNARDAMPAGGCIDVYTRMELIGKSEWVTVSIGDRGTGITPEISCWIFQSFFTTKEGNKGTGLGLAVGKRIVEQHGGHITFKNRESGGAEFLVKLPAVSERQW